VPATGSCRTGYRQDRTEKAKLPTMNSLQETTPRLPSAESVAENRYQQFTNDENRSCRWHTTLNREAVLADIRRTSLMFSKHGLVATFARVLIGIIPVQRPSIGGCILCIWKEYTWSALHYRKQPWRFRAIRFKRQLPGCVRCHSSAWLNSKRTIVPAPSVPADHGINSQLLLSCSKHGSNRRRSSRLTI